MKRHNIPAAGKAAMKTMFPILVVVAMVTGCQTQEPARRGVLYAKPLEGGEVYDKGKIEITCKPAYYRRMDDSLVPVHRAEGDLSATGIVLEIVQPECLAGQVVAFHFDFPEPWNHWYKPGLLYRGRESTNYIGRLVFMCDHGWPAVSTNSISAVPNPAGGAKGKQPPISP